MVQLRRVEQQLRSAQSSNSILQAKVEHLQSQNAQLQHEGRDLQARLAIATADVDRLSALLQQSQGW